MNRARYHRQSQEPEGGSACQNPFVLYALTLSTAVVESYIDNYPAVKQIILLHVRGYLFPFDFQNVVSKINIINKININC